MPRFYRENISLAGEFAPTKVFLGEGSSEVFLIDKALELNAADPLECCIFCIEGIKKLDKKMRILSQEENFESVSNLGFLVDADTTPEGRVRSIITVCAKYGFTSALATLPEDGVIVDNGRKLGIFTSPGNRDEGQIEDMVLNEIKTKDVFSCLEIYEECLADNNLRKLSKKGLVQTYISWMNGSLCGLGRAFDAGHLEINHPAYRGVVRWIVSLI